MTILLPIVAGKCIGQGWNVPGMGFPYPLGDIPQVCPDALCIRWTPDTNPPADSYVISVDIPGIGKAGESPIGTCNAENDPDGYVYTNFDVNAFYLDARRGVFFDVWRAYRDAVWTSSLVISIYVEAVAFFPSSVAGAIQVFRRNHCLHGGDPMTDDLAAVQKAHTATDNDCTGTINATLTVYDDGTFELA